jgi:hypothetical protein
MNWTRFYSAKSIRISSDTLEVAYLQRQLPCPLAKITKRRISVYALPFNQVSEIWLPLLEDPRLDSFRGLANPAAGSVQRAEKTRPGLQNELLFWSTTR